MHAGGEPPEHLPALVVGRRVPRRSVSDRTLSTRRTRNRHLGRLREGSKSGAGGGTVTHCALPRARLQQHSTTALATNQTDIWARPIIVRTRPHPRPDQDDGSEGSAPELSGRPPWPGANARRRGSRCASVVATRSHTTAPHESSRCAVGGKRPTAAGYGYLQPRAAVRSPGSSTRRGAARPRRPARRRLEPSRCRGTGGSLVRSIRNARAEVEPRLRSWSRAPGSSPRPLRGVRSSIWISPTPPPISRTVAPSMPRSVRNPTSRSSTRVRPRLRNRCAIWRANRSVNVA